MEAAISSYQIQDQLQRPRRGPHASSSIAKLEISAVGRQTSAPLHPSPTHNPETSTRALRSAATLAATVSTRPTSPTVSEYSTALTRQQLSPAASSIPPSRPQWVTPIT